MNARINREKNIRSRGTHRVLFRMAVVVVLVAIVFFGMRYLRFIREMIFKESAGHLTEIYEQVNHSLNNLVRQNWEAMQMCAPYLRDVSDEAMVGTYVQNIKADMGFTDFLFLSREGEYRTIAGKKGYLILMENLTRLFLNGEEIVTTSVQIGESEIMVFAIPCTPGTYCGMEYEAMAITFNNNDMVKALEISAFGGEAKSYVICSDGRVLVDNANEQSRSVYNLFGMLRERSDMTNADISHLIQEIQAEKTGVTLVRLDGKSSYLVFESMDVENWSIIGLVPADVVNASMNKLQTITMFVVITISASLFIALLILLEHNRRKTLKAKDIEILYREELFSTLSNNVDDIFLMLDSDNLHVDYVSPNIDKLIGISEEEARANVWSVRNLEGNEYAIPILDLMKDIPPGQQDEWEREYVHQKTREIRWFRITVLCRVIQSKKKYIIVLSDRSKEKKINQELEAAVNTANRASRAKSIFLSNMSHDIRTPMNAVIGFATLVLSNIDSRERVREYAIKIISSADHLMGLINDVLDMSRIENGKIQIKETEECLSDILHDIKSIVGSQICTKQLSLYMKIADDTCENVSCDKMRLKQLLLNLLSNAIKFTPAEGSIFVQISQLGNSPDGKGVFEIRVKDTGIGMSPEFVSKLFDPFEREHTSTVSGTQGTGLGMAISKNIIDLMGGSIRVVTKQGAGTEFIVELPLKLGTAAATIERIRELEGAKALVVDSNCETNTSTVKALAQLGMEAEGAESGEEAKIRSRQALEAHHAFQVYVIDQKLSDMNGADAVEQICSAAEDPLPIIVLTAYDWTEIAMPVNDRDSVEFCSKPVFRSDIQAALLTALRKRQGRTEQVLPFENTLCFQGKRILLAEDNALNQEIAKEILEDYGFVIETASDGGEVMQKVICAEPGYYSLILMDIQMPVLNGYEAARRIRALENPLHIHLPIIAMTANAFEEDRNEAKESGMDGFLPKPLDFRALIWTLEKLFCCQKD